MPRILHIVPSLECSGLTTQLLHVLKGLSKEHEMTVCALSARGPLEEQLAASGVPLEVIEFRSSFNFYAALQLQRLISRVRPEIIETWGGAANTIGRTSARWARVNQIICHDDIPFPPLGEREQYKSKLLDRRTTRFVAATEVAYRRLVKRLGAERCRKIPAAADSSSVKSPVPREEFFREFDLPPEMHYVGCAGRLVQRKRFKDLIWAADMLKFYRPDVKLLIVGEGPQRWRLEKFRGQCLIDDQVHFLGERTDLARILPHLNLFWQADDRAGTCSAIVEAMAGGLPVVASDIPAHREFVRHGETGLLIQVGDRAEFANAANRLINDRDLARRFGEQGRAHVAQRHSSAIVLDAYRELYRGL